MKKLNFILKEADQKTRLTGIIALAIAFAAILLVIISALTAVNGSVTKLPVLKIAFTEDQLDEFDDAFEEWHDELEEAIEDEDNDDLVDRVEDALDMDAEDALDLFDPVSLNTMRRMYGVFEEDDEIVSALDAVVSGIGWYAFFLCAFVALSALFMKKGLFIFATVLSTVFFFVFVGAVGFFFFLALCVAYSVFSSKVKKAYKLYKNAYAAQA